MKFSPTHYALALLEAVNEKPRASEKISVRFLEVLKKNGDRLQAGKILKEVERISLKRSGYRAVAIETARPLSTSQEQELRRHFNQKDHIDIRVNPELVAGVKIVIDGEWVIDASLRRKLKNLFGDEASIGMRTSL